MLLPGLLAQRGVTPSNEEEAWAWLQHNTMMCLP